jgi:hypothetical protein
VSAAALGESPYLGLTPIRALEPVDIESGSCALCGHPEEAHELLLTSAISWVICHEPTDQGECFRVRHARGIAFGACRRDPA